MKTQPLPRPVAKTDDDLIKEIVAALKKHASHFDGGEAEYLITEKFVRRNAPTDINRRVRLAYDATH